MQEVSIGIQITEDGLDFFGTDEVNALIAQGYVVKRIEPGNVMVEEVEGEEGADDEGEELTLAGADLTVTLEKPA